MNILEIRSEIEKINNRYDEMVNELKLAISDIEEQRKKELGDLPGMYDAECSRIIEDYEAGCYNKITGVSIRTLKNVVIEDESLIGDEYKKTVIDDKKIKADMKESGYTMTIPGVKVVEKHSVAVSLK